MLPLQRLFLSILLWRTLWSCLWEVYFLINKLYFLKLQEDDDVLGGLWDQKDIQPQGGADDVLWESQLFLQVSWELPAPGRLSDPICHVLAHVSGLLYCLYKPHCAGGFCSWFQHLVISTFPQLKRLERASIRARKAMSCCSACQRSIQKKLFCEMHLFSAVCFHSIAREFITEP